MPGGGRARTAHGGFQVAQHALPVGDFAGREAAGRMQGPQRDRLGTSRPFLESDDHD
jgi:hypothetical protein